MFSAKEFRSQVEAALEKASGALKWLAQAYCWSDRHLKEIHVIWPDYSTEWLEQRVMAVFNVSIELYARMAGKFGDGDLEKGLLIIDKFGYHECVRAERILPHGKMKKLADVADSLKTISEFRGKIEELGGEVGRERKRTLENIKIPDNGDELEEDVIGRLRSENDILKKENAQLKRENSMLKSKLRLISKAVA